MDRNWPQRQYAAIVIADVQQPLAHENHVGSLPAVIATQLAMLVTIVGLAKNLSLDDAATLRWELHGW
jgi:hypothetical protein